MGIPILVKTVLILKCGPDLSHSAGYVHPTASPEFLVYSTPNDSLINFWFRMTTDLKTVSISMAQYKDCSISSVLSMKIAQSWTKSMILLACDSAKSLQSLHIQGNTTPADDLASRIAKSPGGIINLYGSVQDCGYCSLASSNRLFLKTNLHVKI